MQYEEEYTESGNCCRRLADKLCGNLRVAVVSLLLLMVVVLVITGIYHSIALKEFSNLAIGLGIWLPAALLGMIFVYMTVTCLLESTKRSPRNHCSANNSHSYNTEDVAQFSQIHQETPINLQVKYQCNNSRESVDIPLRIKPRVTVDPSESSGENLSNDGSTMCEQRRKFRSLSSSDLSGYRKNKNLRRRGSQKSGYSPRRFDDSKCLSRSRSRQDLPMPECTSFIKSVSEAGSCEYSSKASRDYILDCNKLIDSPKMFKARTYFAEEEGEEPRNCNYYNKAVGQPQRFRENPNDYSARGKRDLIEYEHGTAVIPPDCYIGKNASSIISESRQMHNYSPERKGETAKYVFQNPGMTRFDISNAKYYPYDRRPLLHSYLPPERIGYLRNNTNILDCASSTESETTSYAYETNLSDNLRKIEEKQNCISTQQATGITDLYSRNTIRSQFPGSRIAVSQFPKNFAEDDGYSMSNRSRAIRKTPQSDEENVEIRSIKHQQAREFLPTYNVHSLSMGCLLKNNESNMQEVRRDVMKYPLRSLSPEEGQKSHFQREYLPNELRAFLSSEWNYRGNNGRRVPL